MNHLVYLIVSMLLLNSGDEVDALHRQVINFPDQEGNFIRPTDEVFRSNPDTEPSISTIDDSFFPSVSHPDDAGASSLPSDYDPGLNNLTTFDDFVDFFEINPFDIPLTNFTITSRLGGGAARVVEELPQANCMPEEMTVDLELTQDAGVTYFPSCVRIPRCGGCCFIPQHSCQPVDKEVIQVRVMKVRTGMATSSRRSRRTRRDPDFEVVNVERHTSCTCGCTVKEDSCDAIAHVYNPNKCSCDCRNKEAETKCLNSITHRWDKSTCQCLCRTISPCSTGQIFSHTSCSCA